MLSPDQADWLARLANIQGTLHRQIQRLPVVRQSKSLCRKGLDSSGIRILGSLDDLGGRTALGSISVVDALSVVEAKIALNRGFELGGVAK